MRFKSTLLLAVLFVLVGGYVYFYEVRRGAEQQKAEEDAKKVFVFEKDDVRRIYLKNYSDTMILRHDESGWEFDYPLETRGDETQINVILTSLESAEIERTVEDSVADYKTYGLDDPQVAIQIETDQTVFDTLFMGNHNPTQSFVYARFSGQNRVILVPATIYNNSNKKFFALRDKSVLPVDRERVTRLALSREEEDVSFERKDGVWWMKTPIEVRADHGKIERIINNISKLQAKEIPSEGGEDPAKFGFDNPWGRVDFYLGENMEMKSLIVGKAMGNGDVYVRDASRDPVFIIPPAIVKQINEDVDGYRDRRALDLERQSIVEIGLIYPDETIRCERDSVGNWFYYTEESPIRSPANTGRMNRLLSDLTTLHIEEYVGETGGNLEPYGLKQPRAEIEILQNDGKSRLLEIGKKSIEEIEGKEKESVYVMNNVDGWIYTVKGNAADKLFVDVDELREEKGGEAAVGGSK